MARPERNNVDYFPHIISDGSRMMIIENQYGLKGYGAFFKLLERLGKQDFHIINLNSEAEIYYLMSRLKFEEEEKLFELLDSMVKVNLFDKELYQKYKILWSRDFTDSVAEAYIRRSNNPLQKSDIINILVNDGEINSNNKVKKRKEGK